ncbi:acylphosphatase [Vulcanisaeta thermophila]|uniref:acylphosphatase n=1 Tax=Vulcanisaeta thermophila TaxID=867917 RepID=UPI0008533BFC|nr:acylphosphatase [Vulcanisaeta thermophila]
MGIRRVHVLVRGLVQGVGFRAFVARNARRLGVKGFVRNLPDGFTVEVVAEGEEDSVNKLLELIRRGPPGAVVEDVEVIDETPTGEFQDFQITY